jgi:hypothetical protein
VWFSVARSDDGRVQRGLVAHLGRTVYVKEVKASSLLECGGQLRGSNILEDEGIKITRNTRSHSPIDTASHLLRLELWTTRLLRATNIAICEVRFKAHSQNCRSVCLSTRNNSAPTWRVSRNFIFRRFLKICRGGIKVLLQSDKNNGSSTWRPMSICDNISFNCSYNEKCFRQTI